MRSEWSVAGRVPYRLGGVSPSHRVRSVHEEGAERVELVGAERFGEDVSELRSSLDVGQLELSTVHHLSQEGDLSGDVFEPLGVGCGLGEKYCGLVVAEERHPSGAAQA